MIEGTTLINILLGIILYLAIKNEVRCTYTGSSKLHVDIMTVIYIIITIVGLFVADVLFKLFSYE